MAVQLCSLPWLGYVPDEVAAAPAAAVGRLSRRLGIAMGELRGFGEREQTRTDHLREMAGYAGWRSMEHDRPWRFWPDGEPTVTAYRRHVPRNRRESPSP